MLTLDFSDFEKMARKLGDLAERQLPYALSKTLNDAAFATRQELVTDTWPSHVVVKNRQFIGAALRVEKATKQNLSVSIVDRLERTFLTRLEKGGTKVPMGRSLVVPAAVVRARKGARGTPPSLRAKNVANSFVADLGRGHGRALWQRVGGKKRRRQRLRLLYSLRASVPTPALVPWHASFDAIMRREIAARFPEALAYAIRTARGA